ncbi:MAG: hypothetical protein ACE5JE_00290 [Thermoplasmata archaeon]
MEASRARTAIAPWLHTLVIFAVVASLVEFVLLRLLLRGGAFAPPGAVMNAIFDFLLRVGLAALNFSFVAAGVALALVAFLLLQGGARQKSVALLIAVLLGVGLLLPLLHLALPWLYHALSMAIVIPLLLLFPRKRSWDFLAACTIGAALVATYYFQASLSAPAVGIPLPFATEIFSVGEILAVTAPFLLLLGRHWRPWLVPLAVLPVVIYLLASQSAFVSLVAVWTVYFTLFLPVPIYALALGAYTYDLADLLYDRPRRWMGMGLLLIALAGRMFQVTYLAQLSLLGLILLVLPATALGLRSSEPAGSPTPPEPSRSVETRPEG